MVRSRTPSYFFEERRLWKKVWTCRPSASKVSSSAKRTDFISQRVDSKCSICSQLLVRPVTPPCGHFSCFRCLFSVLACARRCPVCSLSLHGPSFVRSAFMNQTLKDRVARLSTEAQDAYFSRFFRDASWNQRRKASKLFQGSPVDVFIPWKIWHRGRIKKLLRYSLREVLVVVEVAADPGSELLLSGKSPRLARRGFFTTSEYRDLSTADDSLLKPRRCGFLSEDDSLRYSDPRC